MPVQQVWSGAEQRSRAIVGGGGAFVVGTGGGHRR